MKRILLLLTIAITTNSFAQQATVKEAWLEKWENSKDYLIKVAEAMPEDKYDFKPTERQMSFKEQLVHIKGNMEWLSTTYFSSSEMDKGEKTLPETKAETIELLKKAFAAAAEKVNSASNEDLKTTVEFFAGPKSKLQILNLLQDHLTHHRGQLVVYLNLNEVEPPRFSGW